MKPLSAAPGLLLFGCILLRLSPASAAATAAAAPSNSDSNAGATAASAPRPVVVCDRVFEDFSQDPVGSFPSRWRTKYDHNLQEAKREKLFTVEQNAANNGKHLRARYGTHTITLIRVLNDWDLKAYPYLQWRWQAITLPKGGNEASSKNDTAASVYAVWKARWPFQVTSFRYSWSSTLPVGTYVKKRLGHEHTLVLQTGADAAGRWHTERVNVRKHFRQYVDKSLKKPISIAMTTDADGTESTAEALYADFKLCRVTFPKG